MEWSIKIKNVNTIQILHVISIDIKKVSLYRWSYQMISGYIYIYIYIYTISFNMNTNNLEIELELIQLHFELMHFILKIVLFYENMYILSS